VPHVDPKVIGREEGLPVGGDTQRIYVVLMAVLELLPLYTFEALAHYLAFWEDEGLWSLASETSSFIIDFAVGNSLSPNFIVYLPQFDDPVIGREQL
jgi:hypothetical protein